MKRIFLFALPLVFIACSKENSVNQQPTGGHPSFQNEPDDDKIWKGEGAPRRMSYIVGTEIWDCLMFTGDCFYEIVVTPGIAQPETPFEEFKDIVDNGNSYDLATFFSEEENWDELFPQFIDQPQIIEGIISGEYKFIRLDSEVNTHLFPLVHQSVTESSFELEDNQIAFMFEEEQE